MRVYVFAFVTAFFMLLSACGNSSETSKTSTVSGAEKKSDASSSAIKFSIDNTLVTGRKNKFKADLNGDGMQDSISVVDLALMEKSLPSDTKVVQPWKFYGEGTAPLGITHGSKLGLFIEFGAGSSKSTYLIADVNSPSVLDTEAATELAPIKLAAVEPEDAKQLKKHARGELIVIPTEAGIDTYLYWDGERFVVYEPSDTP